MWLAVVHALYQPPPNSNGKTHKSLPHRGGGGEGGGGDGEGGGGDGEGGGGETRQFAALSVWGW